jgi:serine/threonine protein kinase
MLPGVVTSTTTGTAWIIGDDIGAGAHGRVCAAYTIRPLSQADYWPSPVVLKFVHSANVNVVNNEKRAALYTNSRHLCRLLDSFAHGPEYHCFIYERLEVTLEEVLHNKMYFDEMHAFLHIVLGVQALHSAGFLHRDLKPANVMFCDGVGKLIDYGFTAPIGEGGPPAFAVPYRAPEIVLGRTCTVAGDAWAMGVIAAEMATRTPLFPHTANQDNAHIQMSMERALGIRQGCLSVDDASVLELPALELGKGRSHPQRVLCAQAANSLLIVSPRARHKAMCDLHTRAAHSTFATIHLLLVPA